MLEIKLNHVSLPCSLNNFDYNKHILRAYDLCMDQVVRFDKTNIELDAECQCCAKCHEIFHTGFLKTTSIWNANPTEFKRTVGCDAEFPVPIALHTFRHDLDEQRSPNVLK